MCVRVNVCVCNSIQPRNHNRQRCSRCLGCSGVGCVCEVLVRKFVWPASSPHACTSTCPFHKAHTHKAIVGDGTEPTTSHDCPQTATNCNQAHTHIHREGGQGNPPQLVLLPTLNTHTHTHTPIATHAKASPPPNAHHPAHTPGQYNRALLRPRSLNHHTRLFTQH
jgi:hypothetical protein